MELKIEKMIYGGDGLARMPGEGSSPRSKTVFVPFVLAGEEVSAVLTHEKPGFNRALAGRIIEKSAARVEPACQYFYRCGGCHYQHADYAEQLRIKQGILLETLRRMARIDHAGEVGLHGSEPWNYRNRTRMHVEPGTNFALGYYRFNSRDLLPVGECPISSPLINRALEQIWHVGRAGKIPAGTEEVEFFANADDSALLIELYSTYNAEGAGQDAFTAFSEAIAARLPQLRGICSFAKGSTLFPWETAAWKWGTPHLDYASRYGIYRVQAGSFFQTNRFLIDKLVELAIAGAGGGVALDLYAGTGLFSAPLAERFAKVIAVEPALASFADLQHNRRPNMEVHRLTTEEFLRRHAGELKPELVIVDPPRAGLDDRVTRSLLKMAMPRLTYVSCDPATLARDLRVFTDAGYRIAALDLVDLFPQTFHLETVVRLER